MERKRDCRMGLPAQPGVSEDAWRDKAHRIISQLCLASYERANRLRNGKLHRRHVPYSVPEAAQALIEALDRNDEETAKALFLFNYDIKGQGK